MARGWESKSVESQIDSAVSMKSKRFDSRTPEDIVKEGKREGLMLSRVRVLHDLQTANNPRYIVQLEQALAHLDHELTELG